MDLFARSKGKVCLAVTLCTITWMQPWILSSTVAADPSAPLTAEAIDTRQTPVLQDDSAVRRLFEQGDVEGSFALYEATRGRRFLQRRQGLAGDKGRAEDKGREGDKEALPIRPSVADFDSARDVLDPGTLMLAFHVDTQGTIVFLIDGDEGFLAAKELPRTADDLQRQVDRLLFAIQGAQAPGGQFFDHFTNNAQGLYDDLLAPLEKWVAPRQRLVLVPDGPLHRLPWGTLVRPYSGDSKRPWRYLIEWKSLHITLSASVYAELRSAPRDALNHSSSVAAFGGANYGGSSSGDDGGSALRGETLGDIPGTGKEVQQMSRVFPEAQVFSGSLATKEQLKALDDEVDILHLGLHGQLDWGAPWRSALIFSPGIFSSGRLEVGEIWQDLQVSAHLVVLAACNSAVGPQDREEGMLGLAQAFLAAGSRSVVASLWQVDDQRTHELMEAFYLHLGVGTPQGEALRLAQIQLIDEGLTPYDWAAFQVHGDWR